MLVEIVPAFNTCKKYSDAVSINLWLRMRSKARSLMEDAHHAWVGPFLSGSIASMTSCHVRRATMSGRRAANTTGRFVGE
jgi:hypothetical protein